MINRVTSNLITDIFNLLPKPMSVDELNSVENADDNISILIKRITSIIVHVLCKGGFYD